MPSHLVCYISNGLLALLLVIQQMQSNRINKGLIDKILENKGLNSIPEEHPVADMIAKLNEKKVEPLTETQKRLMKNAQERVRFNIPGMPMFKGK